MATVDATVGGANANSYATVAQADTYLLQERVGGEAWDLVADKPAALIMATIELDKLRFAGARADTDQALEWPRLRAYLPDGRLIASDALPVQLVRATCELALWLAGEDRTQGDGQVLESLKAGPIELDFASATSSGNLRQNMPPVVKSHLAPLLPYGFLTGSGQRVVLRA